MRKVLAIFALIAAVVMLPAVANAQGGDNITTCPAGTVQIAAGEGHDGMQSVTVQDVDGFTITVVYVKGGPGYNTYTTPPWVDLTAPINASGGPADISHWLACGVATETTTETTTQSSTTTSQETTTDATTTEETTSEPTNPTSTAETNTGSSTAETTTSAPAVVLTTSRSATAAALPQGEKLAYTGMSRVGWLLGLAGLLLAAGGAAIFVARRRGRAR